MTTAAYRNTAAGAAPGRALGRGRAALAFAREQSFVATGQVLSGVGNLVFVLVMARVLEPRAFSQLAAFLAMYLLVHVPASSLSAGSALRPAINGRTRRRALGAGVLVGVVLLAAAVPLAPVLDLPVALICVLAAAPPAAGLLALERGRLYGSGQLGRSVGSLLVEPAVRLTAGIALALAIGPTGGAIGVIAAGYCALLVASGRRRRSQAPDVPGAVVPGASGEPPQTQPAEGEQAVARHAASASGWVIVAFLLLAVLQNQDVLFANALLPSVEAGRFAVLSTLGGISALASTTVPLVLLPRAARGERHALPVAVLVAAALGLGAVLALLIAPAHTIGAIFGNRYANLHSLAPLYLLAMALLGIARVLVAARCAGGRARPMVLLLALVAAAHVGLILAMSGSARGVATATLSATVLLAIALAAGTVIPLPERTRRGGRSTPFPRSRGGHRPEQPQPVDQQPLTSRLRTALPVLALMGIGLALRLDVTRGIWVDEATSISQARMPFGQMIHNIRTTDVHPPGHHTILWLTIRLIGSSQLAVRIPSIIAGTLLVGALYLAGRELYDRRAGLVAAAVGTVAPFMVWYSQEARMYAFFMLFATLALWAQVRAVRRGQVRDWALYAVFTAAMLWTQYFTILPILVQQVGFLVAAWQRRREGRALGRFVLGWGAAIFCVALAFLPLWPILHDQLQAYKSRGSGALASAPSQAGAGVSQAGNTMSIYAVIANFIWAIWGYHSDQTMAAIAALWPAGMLLALLTLGRGRSRVSLLLVGIAVIPAAILFVIGLQKRDLFEIRYFAAAVPALLLLFARVATGWTTSRLGRIALAAGLVATMAVGLADQQLNGTNPRRYDFEGALARVQREMRPGDTLVYEPGFLQPVISYYVPKLNARPLDAGLPKAATPQVKTVRRVRHVRVRVRRHGSHHARTRLVKKVVHVRVRQPAQRRSRVFLLASFLDKPQYASGTGAAIAKMEKALHRRLIGHFTEPQIKVWVFQ